MRDVDVFPDFDAVGGRDTIMQALGALLTVVLIFSVLMLLVSAIVWAVAAVHGNQQAASQARTGALVALPRQGRTRRRRRRILRAAAPIRHHRRRPDRHTRRLHRPDRQPVERGLDPTSTADIYAVGLRLRVVPALGHIASARKATKWGRPGDQSRAAQPHSARATAHRCDLAGRRRCATACCSGSSGTSRPRPPAATCTPTTGTLPRPPSRPTRFSPLWSKHPIRSRPTNGLTRQGS